MSQATLALESPMLEWRLQCNLTQKQLAEEAGVSVLTVVRNEQLLYSSPSPKIMHVLIHRLPPVEALTLNAKGVAGSLATVPIWDYYENLYHRAQYLHRAKTDWSIGTVKFNRELRNFDSKLNDPELRYIASVTDHPFQTWRDSLGFAERLTFCRAACLSPPIVHNYESGKQRSMPRVVKDALTPLVGSMSYLEDVGRKYYDALNGGSGKIR